MIGQNDFPRVARSFGIPFNSRWRGGERRVHGTAWLLHPRAADRPGLPR